MTQMVNVKRKLYVSFIQKNAALLIQLASSLALARLLSPAEIGIFAIGSVAVSFLHVLRDLGVSSYVIQERELTIDRIRTAQGFMWVTSGTLALLVAAGAQFAGEFYGEAGVTSVLYVLAFNTLLLPIGAITVSLMNRRLEFERLMVLSISASLMQAAVSVFLASRGHGYMSLAWGNLASGLTTAVLASLYHQKDEPWLPSFSERRRVFAGCSKLSSSSILYEMGLAGPELVCGRVLGFEAVAFYSKAQSAAGLVLRGLVDSIAPVALAYYAHCSRNGLSLREPYLKALACLSAVALPAFACLAVMAEPAILLLYGNQWVEVATPLRIACISAAAITLANVAGAVIVGSGRAGTNLALHAVFQPVKVALVLFASQAGLNWIVAAVSLADVGLSAASIAKANAALEISWSECWAACRSSVLIGLIEAGVAYATIAAGTHYQMNHYLVLVGSACVIIPTWLLIMTLMKHPLLTLRKG